MIRIIWQSHMMEAVLCGGQGEEGGGVALDNRQHLEENIVIILSHRDNLSHLDRDDNDDRFDGANAHL